MTEHCDLDIYEILDYLQNDVEEENEILGESLENFWWVKWKLTETEEFEKMNEIYKKTLNL